MGGRQLYRMISEHARSMGRIAGRLRGEKERVARLAVLVLETVADKALAGSASPEDVRRLEELAVLLRLYGIPSDPVEKARKLLLRVPLRTSAPTFTLESGITALT
ncbi:MAG: hypothetical protein F7C34_01840 [Desulfurococcales archaeon]|nr:hypothetical protein [Desulfurococcales archaeon]